MVSLAAAAALASVAASSWPAWGVVLALLAASAALLRRHSPTWRLRITPGGGFELQRADAPEGSAARVVFVSRGLIVLACGKHAVALWPDTLSPAQFRTVSVHARWPAVQHVEPQGGDDAS